LLVVTQAAISSAVMHNSPEPEVPYEALEAASFAESLALQYVAQGGDTKDLFVAFAGLVAGASKEIAARCLIAVDEEIARRAIS
jgi:hypothetical protein